MTVEEVKNMLPLDLEGYIYADLYDCSMSQEDFVVYFNGAELSYTSLSTHPNATTGWCKQFEKWRDNGVIPV